MPRLAKRKINGATRARKASPVNGHARTIASARRAGAASKRISNGHKTAVSKSPPTWIADEVFKRAKIVAWSGQITPLSVEMIYPENVAFIEALDWDHHHGPSWLDLIHPIDRARVVRFFQNVKSTGSPGSVEYRVVDTQGAVVWLCHSVDVVTSTQDGVQVRGFIRDIQELKEYQLESLRVSEREQNRIGQDLHDDLCQVLAGLSCLMRVIEGRVVAKAPEEQENLRELNQQIIDAMHRTRALTHGLFPGKIQIADIRGALLELASQIKARFNVRINTQFAGRFPKHTTAQIIQIYRISQEAMSNAIKHGRATEIEVRLEAQPTGMELSVRDNGSGFPKNESAAPGVGLNIMKYRADMLGGEVAVIDHSPAGVLVRLQYPFATSG